MKRRMVCNKALKRISTYVFPATVFAVLALFATSCSQNSKAQRKNFGQIEVDEIDVASRLPARIKKIAVKPGQRVKAGDILVEFEDDVLAAKRKQAEAMIAAAQSRRELSENAVRPEEKEQVHAAVEAARKQMGFAKTSYERASNVFKEGAISEQALDEIRFKYQAATEQYKAALAKEKMAKTGARTEEKAGAQALLDQARNALAEVDAYSKDISLTAPIDGEVYQILNHEGELVPTGYPVVTLLKLSSLWVSFRIPENRLDRFPMSKAVKVMIPALGQKQLAGQVNYISPFGGFAVQTTTQGRGSFDLKTFELRVNLADLDPALRPGMTAVVLEE